MADPSDRTGQPESTGSPPDGTQPSDTPPSDPRSPASTPFDHPLFLPGLLGALALWFGYDGWLNDDPEMRKHLAFNRWGAGILVLLTSWFGYRGIAEMRESKNADSADSGAS